MRKPASWLPRAMVAVDDDGAGRGLAGDEPGEDGTTRLEPANGCRGSSVDQGPGGGELDPPASGAESASTSGLDAAR